MKFKAYPIYYHDGRRWRWRLTARNGVCVDASTQSFYSKRAAENNARLTAKMLTELLK